MTKIRIYELAKELNISSKELIKRIEDLELNINSHMSTIDDEEAEMIKELLTEDEASDIVENKNDILEEEYEEKEIVTTKKHNKKKIKNISNNNKQNDKGEGLIIDIENNIM